MTDRNQLSYCVFLNANKILWIQISCAWNSISFCFFYAFRVEKRLNDLCFSYLILTLICGIHWIWQKIISWASHLYMVEFGAQNVVHWRRERQKLQYACLENPMNSMKKQKDKTLKDELPRLVGAQNAIGDQWRNNSWKNEEMEPKQKQHPLVDVTGDESKVRCCTEQLHWNLECWVHKSRQIGSGQTGDGKSECQHFRNQWTKMDWNEWI